MAGLQHVHIQQVRLVHHAVAVERGVDGERPLERVRLAHMVQQASPPRAQLVLGGFGARLIPVGAGGVVAAGRLAGQTPDHRQGGVARDQVVPVVADRRLAAELQVVAPAAHQARHQPRRDQVGDALVGPVPPGRVRRSELVAVLPGARPRVSRLVLAARVERRLVRIQPGDDLDEGESLAHAVRGQPAEVVGPREALGEPHPPRVAQPRERRPVGVLQARVPGRIAQRPVPVERVVALVRDDLDFALPIVQTRVGGIAAPRPIDVNARQRRRVPERPPVSAAPEGGDAPLAAVRVAHQRVQVDLRVRVGALHAGLH